LSVRRSCTDLTMTSGIPLSLNLPSRNPMATQTFASSPGTELQYSGNGFCLYNLTTALFTESLILCIGTLPTLSTSLAISARLSTPPRTILSRSALRHVDCGSDLKGRVVNPERSSMQRKFDNMRMMYRVRQDDSEPRY
ncbi:hypothetical protein KCU67_g113, partial [Aureobasidium melanogenum]